MSVALGTVCQLVKGGLDPRRQAGTTFAHYSIPAFDSGSGPAIEVGAQIHSQKTPIPRGVVLVSKLNPRIPRVWHIDDDQPHQRICSTEFVPLQADPKQLTSEYLSFALREALQAGFIKGNTAAATKSRERAKPMDFLRLKIKLPLIPEQVRIVDQLSRAENIVGMRREAEARTKEIIPALFLDMFGHPARNPRGWGTKRLGEIARIVGGSSLPIGMPFANESGGHLLVKVSDMNRSGNEVYLLSTAEWIAKDVRSYSRVPAGAVVLPKRGAAIATNKKRLTVRPALLDPNLMGIVADESIVLSQYLYQWFITFDLSSITSGTTVPQLNKGDLAPLEVPVPPQALQALFAERAKRTGLLVQAERAAKRMAEQTFRAMLAGAFEDQCA